MKKSLGVATAALALTLPLAACGASSQAGSGSTSNPLAGKTIALVNGDNSDPFFFSIWAGAQAEAKKKGINLVEQAPTTYDYTQQVPLFNDEVAKQVAGIILSPDSNTAYKAAYDTAHQANVPVVDVNTTQKNQSDNPNVLAFLGSDPVLLGQLAAKQMEPLVNQNGLVSVINSVAGSVGSQMRGSGFMDTIKQNDPQMKLLPGQYDLDDISKANSMARDEIQANPDLKGIYAVDSFTGQGVGNAIKSLGKAGTVKLVAIDAEPQEMQLMKDGVIQALIAQQPYQMGVQAVDDLVLSIQGKASQVQRSVILGPIAVTPQNMDSPEIKNTVVYAANKPQG
ncbi:substrate-binding domain-containing protein [Sinomonas susongensis]|uniref:substrate-binding domain-containing protein n=1 Tax=Sinomonas susongensis TaxID=1324851 RepID=UPI001108160E|nr:substrate-binding domain-containing protein [Sinomonas susongensis]